MANAGWYPDPEGRPEHVRYWDGHAWVGDSMSAPAAEPSTPLRPEKPARKALWIGLVLVIVVVFAWGMWDGFRDAVAEDPVTARPTGSVWNESPPPTTTTDRSPSNPAPSTDGRTDCPLVDNVVKDHPRDGLIHGGGLAFEAPDGWSAGGDWSLVLTDQSGVSLTFENTSWASFLAVGQAPSEAGFLDPALTAMQVLECHVTSGRFTGYTGHTIETSEEITVDGRTGWWVHAGATSTAVPGGKATFDVVVVETGSGEGAAVYWAGAVDADAQALADLEAVRAGLQLSD